MQNKVTYVKIIFITFVKDNYKTMKDRILQFMQHEQVTSTQFADKIGVQRSSVSHILSGRNNPSFDFIRKILISFPKIRAEWLILGEGEMYKVEESRELFDEDPPVYGEESGESATEKEKKIQQDVSVDAGAREEKQAGIERVVIFYRNNTFTEYHPH